MKINIKQTIEGTISPEEVVQMLLKDRGIADVASFLNPTHPETIPLESFFKGSSSFKADWKRTIKLLKEIHKEGKTIVVYTDYDADGVTGGTIMWETLNKLGFKVMPYIPERKKEGYGFSEYGLDQVKEQFDPALIISVDHGIVAHTQIAYAKKIGIPIIVTDHHQKQETNPEDAFAIFHVDTLCGSSVAYFVAKEITASFEQKFDEFRRDYIALAAIGTIADLVPLTGVSRNVAKYGLEALNSSVRYGLRHILKQAGLDGKKISPYEVGYIIAPRINAFGRLGHALDALRLLCTTSYPRAVELAAKAGTINKTRQDLVAKAQRQALKMADVSKKIIIIRNDEWEEGIIGLIAGKLMNAHNKPVIVMTRSDGHAKASVRSLPGVDITAFLTSKQLRKYLTDVGGHAAAAGFTIPIENIDDFVDAAHAKAEKEITEKMLVPSINVDFQIPLKVISKDLIEKLQQLEPFGMGNPQPNFLSDGVIKDTILFGKKKEYTKLLLFDGDMAFLEVAFFDKAKEFPKTGEQARIIYTLKIDTWGGKSKVVGMGRTAT